MIILKNTARNEIKGNFTLLLNFPKVEGEEAA